MSPRNDESDEQLLACWRAGDTRAGARLFDRYHKALYRFFHNKIGPDSDDLIQNTFLGLNKGLERFRGDAGVRTLIYVIARNQLNMHFRRVTRDRLRFDPAEVSVAACDTTPTQAQAAREDRALLVRALRQLPVDTQLMLELHYWERMKTREIAAILGIPESTVKTRMRRGRQQLLDEMARLSNSPQELDESICSLSEWVARMRVDLDSGDDEDN